MNSYSTDNLKEAPLMCAVIVLVAVGVIFGLSFGFKGQIQF